MGFNCGIVGLPNVGKSTLFNALTNAGIGAENFPFCTIQPNLGVVAVPDERLDQLAAMANSKKITAATIEFVDIAGLVAGASKGEGLGNQFLANIRETDAIAHVVRCFEDSNIVHVNGGIAPLSDIDIINTELALADLETVDKVYRRCQKVARAKDQEALALLPILDKIVPILNQALPIRSRWQQLEFDETDLKLLKSLNLITTKPMLYIANVKEDGFENNPHLPQLEQLAQSENTQVVILCNQLEAEIAELNNADKLEFLEQMGMQQAGLNRVIRAGYQLLGLRTYFTVGVKETRAWTITKGSTAPQAAGKIHSDFEKGFIRAEVISYPDYIQYQGENAARDAGKWRLEGKDYIVADGDVIHFRFNV